MRDGGAEQEGWGEGGAGGGAVGATAATDARVISGPNTVWHCGLTAHEKLLLPRNKKESPSAAECSSKTA